MMTEDQIKEVALKIISRIAPEADIANLDPADRLRNQFDFDSVDFMNFAVALQSHLKVEISEADYPQLASLNGCIAFLKSRCSP
ncbi:MAG: acyl carrier protein [Desulfocapsaceae bacterium]|nr:acyl carrier protein [Desulfocapsaceae bacterium]